MTLRNLYILMLMMAGLVTLQACDANDGPLEDAAEALRRHLADGQTIDDSVLAS